MIKENEPKGLSIIKNVMSELHKLISEYSLRVFNSIIVDISQLINEEYASDISRFRVITSQIGFVIEGTIGFDHPEKYSLLIFSDNRISSMDQVNLADMLGLFDVDLTTFPYLSKCTFHLNRLYNTEQIKMIPSIKYIYEIE